MKAAALMFLSLTSFVSGAMTPFVADTWWQVALMLAWPIAIFFGECGEYFYD